MSAAHHDEIPLCDIQSQYRQLQSELEATALRVLASGQVILGPEVEALEEELAQYCQTNYAVGCSSGSDALLLALRAADIGPGDEVILPPFTFFATVGAVCRAGARPVFADIDEVSYNIDPKKIQEQITSKTKAILVVHLYGQCAEMNAIQDLAIRHNLMILEDAAQSIGAEYQGNRAGSMGSMGCFSFYPSKNLGAFGDAGLVTTNNAIWASKLKSLRGHGMEPKYYHKHLGWNARLDALQAALLRVKLPHLDEWTTQRGQVAERYHRLIEEYRLDGLLMRPTFLPNRRQVHNQYIVRVTDGRRDALIEHLRHDKIGCEIYYPVPLHLQECLKDLDYHEGDFPISEQACREVLALPMFPTLSEEQQHRVMESCARFSQKSIHRAA